MIRRCLIRCRLLWCWLRGGKGDCLRRGWGILCASTATRQCAQRLSAPLRPLFLLLLLLMLCLKPIWGGRDVLLHGRARALGGARFAAARLAAGDRAQPWEGQACLLLLLLGLLLVCACLVLLVLVLLLLLLLLWRQRWASR